MSKTALTFGEKALQARPFELFDEWLAAAAGTEPNDPNAVALATVDETGLPDVRMVLLKGFDERGFVFYTNLESRKGRELAAQPKAALCFHWKTLRRQVRVRGAVEAVSAQEADEYYASRARGSRIGAWASRQSQPLDSRETLERRVDELHAEFASEDIPRPPFWSGLRVVPSEIEFWEDGAFRLHDRFRFERETANAAWSVGRLYP